MRLTLCTSHASLKCTHKFVTPSVKNETRTENANNPARLLHGRYGSLENRNEKSLSFQAEELIRLNFGPDL